MIWFGKFPARHLPLAGGDGQMGEIDFATKSVALSKYSDQHQRMIKVAFGFFEFALAPAADCDSRAE
jgi:hypothetical protein